VSDGVTPSASVPGAAFAPELTVLPNSVSLLNAPSASRNSGVFLIVRAGSRDETRQTAGLAHFLEHMFFKGTERRPSALQITREVDSLGGATNAYTDTEEVAYFAEGPAAAVDQLAVHGHPGLAAGYLAASVAAGLAAAAFGVAVRGVVSTQARAVLFMGAASVLHSRKASS